MKQLDVNLGSLFVPSSRPKGAGNVGQLLLLRLSLVPLPVQECLYTLKDALNGRRPFTARRDAGCKAPRPPAKGVGASAAGSGMLLVTGGAGFIGSNLIAALDEAGRAD